MVEMRRVELLTSCLQGRRSSQLSYIPMCNVLVLSTLENKQYQLRERFISLERR